MRRERRGIIVLPDAAPTITRPEDATEHWIAVAKQAYTEGRVTLEQLEEDVAALLAGGAFPGHFIPSGLPAARRE